MINIVRCFSPGNHSVSQNSQALPPPPHPNPNPPFPSPLPHLQHRNLFSWGTPSHGLMTISLSTGPFSTSWALIPCQVTSFFFSVDQDSMLFCQAQASAWFGRWMLKFSNPRKEMKKKKTEDRRTRTQLN